MSVLRKYSEFFNLNIKWQILSKQTIGQTLANQLRILLRSSTCIITLKERNPYVQFYKLCCDQETIRLLTCENPKHKGERSQGVFRSCKEFTKLVENLKWVAWGLDVGTGSGRTSINRVCISLFPYLIYIIAINFVLHV